jgi:hypothetical protein
VVLPAPLGPTIALECPGPPRERRPARARPKLFVAEVDVAEGDVPADALGHQRTRVRGVAQVATEIEHPEDPLEVRHRGLPVDVGLEQLPEGTEEPRLEGRERNQGAGGDAPSRSVGARQAGGEVDPRRSDEEHALGEPQEQPPDHLLADTEVGQPAAVSVIALHRRSLTVEDLAQQEP